MSIMSRHVGSDDQPLAASPHIQSSVAGLLHAALTVLAVDEAAISVMDDTCLVLGESTGEIASRLERTQQFHRAGPTMSVLACGECVEVAGVAAHAQQWPEFCQLAQRLDVHSVIALPLTDHGTTLGVLAVYRRAEGPWTADERRRATLVARRLAYTLAGGRDVEHARATGREDRSMATTRDSMIVPRAQHALAARTRTTDADAMVLIRRLAHQTGLTLEEVSRAVLKDRTGGDSAIEGGQSPE